VALCLGAFAVIWGAADVASRVSTATFGEGANLAVFGPAAAIQDPSILNAVNAPATTTPFAPTRLKIPAIGVDAAVESVGQRSDGAMATPTDYADVAWYALGGRPGGEGNAVFAGHVNNALTKSGVFAHLTQLHLGDYVTVSDKDGHTLVYKVTAIDQYPADEAPAANIFAAQGPSQLVLITCDGDWVPAQKTFDKRLVITATPTVR
jgi:LPXTG-site transpeptidase (sortase) family protein